MQAQSNHLEIRYQDGDYHVLIVRPDGSISTAFAAAGRDILREAVNEPGDGLNLDNWQSGEGEPEGEPNDYGELVAVRNDDGQYRERDETRLASLIDRLQD